MIFLFFLLILDFTPLTDFIEDVDLFPFIDEVDLMFQKLDFVQMETKQM
jgi:hypothetical protein